MEDSVSQTQSKTVTEGSAEDGQKDPNTTKSNSMGYSNSNVGCSVTGAGASICANQSGGHLSYSGDFEELRERCEKMVYLGVVDFDDHLGDVGKDWTNEGLKI